MKHGLGISLALVLLACEAAPTPGAACTRSSDCASPLVCRHGRCRAECREARDCAVGLRCLLDASGIGACTLPPEETCSADAECGSDLVCAGAQCRTSCSTSLECGALGACSAGSCVTPVSGVDAAMPAMDAGASVDAAQPRDARLVLGDGGRPLSGTGAPCGAGDACPGAYECATAAEPGSVPVCRLPCATDADCAGEGLGSYCYGTHCTTPCDPVRNAGCGTEVCGVYSGNPPAPETMVDYTDCRAAGAIGVDETGCTQELDCAAETTCMFGTCRRTCDFGAAPPAGCAAGQACFPTAPIVNATSMSYGACCPDPSGC